jgi:hypothetical protein
MKTLSSIQKIFRRHSPEILITLGIGGMITSTVLAVKATPKALDMLNDKKEQCAELDEEFTKLDMVKTAGKYYIPAAISGAVSIGCIVCANSVNAKRNAVLATAYKLSETALVEYQEQVIDSFGEKKEKGIREKVAKKKLERNPVKTNDVVITGHGETLCYDAISARYFKSNVEDIRRAVNELNRRMMDEMYISLNDFYYEIGLQASSMGEDLGWNVDNGLIELEFSSHLTEYDTPCLVIDYRVAPKYDYSKLL